MKNLLDVVSRFIREHGDCRLTLFTGLWLALLFCFNYSLDFEDSYIDTLPSFWQRWAAMFALHSIPYLGVCLALYFLKLSKSWLYSKTFWLYVITGFALLSLDRSIDVRPYITSLLQEYDTYPKGQEAYFIGKLLVKFSGLFTIIGPLLFFYFLNERQRNARYFGLTIRNFDVKPYALILGLAAIVVLIGQQFSDIQNFYPKYQRSGGEAFALSQGINEWKAVLAFELAYGFDFISTEFFFRGFLVIGMYRFLGPQALLPMAASYAALHFGKPLTEAISSIFGGYLLGILALHHRNIWGGVIIHVGLAWMMEVAGFLLK